MTTSTDRLTFGRLDGRNVAFSEREQRLFELNDSAAYLWQRLADGVEPDVIMAEMRAGGAPPDVAKACVLQAVADWRRCGLVLGDGGEPQAKQNGPRQMLCVGGVCIEVRFSTDTLASLTMPVFSHLEVEARWPQVVLDVVDAGDDIRITPSGKTSVSCPADVFVPTLKGILTTEILERAAYTVALHAAALVRNDRMLVISGAPGAGKTTLALALHHAGLDFASDDVVLLGHDGDAVGLPFAAGVKSGSWPLLATRWPDLLAVRDFKRPDGRRVRYLRSQSVIEPALRPVGWIVMLRRQSGAVAALSRIDAVTATRGLLEGAFTPGRRLTAAGFEGLTGAVSRAECYELTYSNLDDGVNTLLGACE